MAPGKIFCELPRINFDGEQERDQIKLPTLDAVIGNPPYVEQTKLPKASDKDVPRDQTKEHLYKTIERAWPGIKLSKQSDLHIYFWPVAAQFLDEGGWLGFLTSSSWLDAKYGFPLQRWILTNFRLVSVIESVDEPWFEDARVKTVATIMQRCKDADERDGNLVRFVRLLQPLTEILGERGDERGKQDSVEKLRDLILKTKKDFSNSQLRIMVKRQSDLWGEGLSVAEVLAKQKSLAGGAVEEMEDEDPKAEQSGTRGRENGGTNRELIDFDYGGGKWGKYLRAPDFYFDLMRDFGHRFTRFGEVATVKFGIKSGCDDFFMPRDVSAKLLEKHRSEAEWRLSPLMRRCKRAEVESGKVVVVECGDGTLHPIESTYVRPEVHSLMQVDRPVVSPEQLDRFVLWADKPLKEFKGTYAHDFITWGGKQTFASNKSKSVTVPERETCAARELWYDVTGLKPGIGFWPMAQQYRHIIPANPHGLNCNHNLFDIHSIANGQPNTQALIPILNSTVVAFIKPFYGRYAGTEGNLKTEVVDTLLIEIPDPRNVTGPILKRLEAAFSSMQMRKVTHLVEQAFLDCRTAREVREAAKSPLGLPIELQQPDRRELDDAVFELLGVTDPRRRSELIDQLYREVARHFRSIRIVEVQKMEQRRQGGGVTKVSPTSLAEAAWGELEPEWQTSLAEWLAGQSAKTKAVDLPEGDVRLPAAGNFFEATTLYFGTKPAISHVCASRAEAELLYAIASAGLRGPISIPTSEDENDQIFGTVEERLADGKNKLERLSQEYAGAGRLRDQVATVLWRWFIQGKSDQAAK